MPANIPSASDLLLHLPHRLVKREGQGLSRLGGEGTYQVADYHFSHHHPLLWRSCLGNATQQKIYRATDS